MVGDNPRRVQCANRSGPPGTVVDIPIQLAAQGEENSASFSLNFDAGLLLNPQVSLGSDATSATLTTDLTQLAQGRLGIALSMPSGQTLAAGTRELVVVTFTLASVATQSSTQISFEEQPIAREVRDVNGALLPSLYLAGTLTISVGYEADIAPRPEGSNNGTVSIADWVQVGRIVSGLDIFSCGSEFQKIDCAPRDSLGNGSVTISDWVQAGRYAAGLDPVQVAGGPTCSSASATAKYSETAALFESAARTDSQRVRTVELRTPASRGNTGEVTVVLQAQGDENAIGLSFSFDPAQFKLVSVRKSNDLEDATLVVNSQFAAAGRLGFALALPPGQTFAPGARQVAVVSLRSLRRGTQPVLEVGDYPVKREVVDVQAKRLEVSIGPGATPGNGGKTRLKPPDSYRIRLMR